MPLAVQLMTISCGLKTLKSVSYTHLSTYQDNSRFHMAAVNKDGLYSTVEILLMDEPQTVLLDNEYSDYYRISFGSNDAL